MDGPAALNYATAAAGTRRWGDHVAAVIGWLTLFAVVAAGAYYGVTWRRAMWEATRTVRFTFDITNGYNLGHSVVTATNVPPGQPIPWRDYFTAYLDSYKSAVNSHPDGQYELDYAPGRLLIMSMWVKHLWEHNITAWNREYQTTAPLLMVNTVASGLSAIAIFALVRHWRRLRDGLPFCPRWFHPYRELPAVAAMLAVWLNPALIWETHAWPQWDCWLLPGFLFGVLAISKDKWLLGGFLVAFGAIFKGQVIMVAPVLILWPIFAGRPLEALRFVIGVALLAALIALVWIAREPMARLYLAGCLMAIAAGAGLTGFRRKFDVTGIVAACAAAVLVMLAVFKPKLFDWRIQGYATLLASLVALAPRWTPRKLLPLLITAATAGAIFLAGAVWGERYDWFEVSYHYPTNRRLEMAIGPITNLPGILRFGQFHWRLNDIVFGAIGSRHLTFMIRIGVVSVAALLAIMPIVLAILDRRPLAAKIGLWSVRFLPALLVAWIFPWDQPMPMRLLLVWIFTATIILCGIGAAIQSSRRSPRVILAVFVPWLLMFAIMPQLHERYLIWAAVVLSAGFGLSLGQGLLAVVVMFFAWVNMLPAMLHRDHNFMPDALQMARGMQPGAGWAVLLLGAVYLYLVLTPEKKFLATDGAPMNTDQTSE
jgi:hypothetical protein